MGDFTTLPPAVQVDVDDVGMVDTTRVGGVITCPWGCGETHEMPFTLAIAVYFAHVLTEHRDMVVIAYNTADTVLGKHWTPRSENF